MRERSLLLASSPPLTPAGPAAFPTSCSKPCPGPAQQEAAAAASGPHTSSSSPSPADGPPLAHLHHHEDEDLVVANVEALAGSPPDVEMADLADGERQQPAATAPMATTPPASSSSSSSSSRGHSRPRRRRIASSAPSSSSTTSTSPSSSSSSSGARTSSGRRRSSSSAITFSNAHGSSPSSSSSSSSGCGGGWEAFYAHYKAQRMAKRTILADRLRLEPHVAALFAPPSSYAGSDQGASAVVEGRLYVGSAAAAQDPLWLRAHGITHVLNVADEIVLSETVLHGAGITYRWLNIADHCEFDIRGCFEDAFDFILAAYSLGGRVLVHCAAGVSRSATVAIAFIMHFEKRQLKEALLLVREKRPYVYPNKGFFEALFDFEMELFAMNSLPRDALELHEDC